MAADYDTIHRYSGRAVLWNTAQLRMRADERPRGWHAAWPVPLEAVDVLVLRADDELVARAEGWTEPPLPVSSGTLYKFAKLAADASHGCVTDA